MDKLIYESVSGFKIRKCEWVRMYGTQCIRLQHHICHQHVVCRLEECQGLQCIQHLGLNKPLLISVCSSATIWDWCLISTVLYSIPHSISCRPILTECILSFLHITFPSECDGALNEVNCTPKGYNTFQSTLRPARQIEATRLG